MAIPTVYRWDDKNAPQVTDFQDWTQIKNWYQKIFVDGYLEDDDITPKPGLGWTLTFDDNDNSVYLKYIDDGGDPNVIDPVIRHYYNNVVLRQSFSPQHTFYEKEDGTKVYEMYTGTDYGSSGLIGWNGETTPTVTCVCPWVLIGTDKQYFSLAGFNDTVHLPLIPTEFSIKTDYTNWSFFGDINQIGDGLLMGDWKCMSSGVYTYRYARNMPEIAVLNANHQNTLNASYNFGFNMGRRVNRTFQLNISFGIKGYLFGNPDIIYFGSPLGMKYPHFDGKFYIEPVEIWSYVDQTQICMIPGMYMPLHQRPLSDSFGLIEFDGIGDYVGKSFIGLGQSSYSEFYLCINEDWDVIA